MSVTEIMGAAPWVIVTGLISWVGAAKVYRDKKKKELQENTDRLEIHRDDLMFELLQNARAEVVVATEGMKALRKEVHSLRALEQHFFHFQQSLDHLEAILTAETLDLRRAAERNARAFLNRMRRLQEATGTIHNEMQTIISAENLDHPEKTDD